MSFVSIEIARSLIPEIVRLVRENRRLVCERDQALDNVKNIEHNIEARMQAIRSRRAEEPCVLQATEMRCFGQLERECAKKDTMVEFHQSLSLVKTGFWIGATTVQAELRTAVKRMTESPSGLEHGGEKYGENFIKLLRSVC